MIPTSSQFGQYITRFLMCTPIAPCEVCGATEDSELRGLPTPINDGTPALAAANYDRATSLGSSDAPCFICLEFCE